MRLIPGNVTPLNDKCGDQSRAEDWTLTFCQRVEKKDPGSIVQNLSPFVIRFVMAMVIINIIAWDKLITKDIKLIVKLV